MGEAERIITILTRRQQSLATAESLTGGLLGAALTAVPGASAVYRGGVVAYQTPMKAILADVPEALVSTYDPITAATAAALAVGIRARTGADYALATTGVAGPEPQAGHAVGEVWIGLAGPAGVSATRFDLSGDRSAIRQACVHHALTLLATQLQA